MLLWGEGFVNLKICRFVENGEDIKNTFFKWLVKL
jgi:hypothetical protein